MNAIIIIINIIAIISIIKPLKIKKGVDKEFKQPITLSEEIPHIKVSTHKILINFIF